MGALHDRITAIGFAGAALSVGLIAVSFWYEVVARYFLAAPTVWAYAVASYALCPMIFLAMPEMTRRGAQIVIDYLVDASARNCAPAAERWTVTLATALVCLMGAWITGAETWRQYVQGIETVLAFAVPKWWVSIFVPYGLLNSAIYFFRRLFEAPPVARTDEARRMTWWMVLSGALALLLFLMALGMPLFAAFLVMNVTGVLVLFGPAGFGLFANSIYTTATTSVLAAVPLFIAMGEIMFRSGAMEVLFDSLDRLVGRFRGRQYVVCILLSAILGALSGAAMAVAGLLGRSLFPAMRARGYDTQFSAGTVLAGASLDPIIPPSVLAILVATIADVSTGKMLIAGIIPGLVLTAMFLVYVVVRVCFQPSLAPDIAADGATREAAAGLVAGLKMLPSLLRVLHGDGLDHARNRHADRGGGDRRAGRLDAGRVLRPPLGQTRKRGDVHGCDGRLAAAGHHVFRGDVQPDC